MPSSPQTVTTQIAYDYLFDTSGHAVANAQVHCILNFNQSTLASPTVSIGPIQQSTTTDANGYFQFALVPNASISPANTTYSIITPFNSYDIVIPASAGPFQTTNASIIVNTPTPLAPATTNLTGPITVTGNETVTGNLTVNGTTTLGSTTTGALTTGAASVGGDLTIASTFRLLFGAAVSKIVAGATSISFRNNADNADNLKVTDAGAVTVRNGLTVTAGGETITAGGLTVTGAPDITLGTAASRIVPGSTSLTARNNANSADNVAITDAGIVTLRNALKLPPTAAGTVAATSYGSTSVKIDEKTPSGTGTQSITIPAGFRRIDLDCFVRSTNASQNTDLQLTCNGSSANDYDWERGQLSGAAGSWGSSQGNGVAFMVMGFVIAATGPTNGYSHIRISFMHYNQANTDKTFYSDGTHANAYSAGNVFVQKCTGFWHPASPAALASVGLVLAAGNYAGNSVIIVTGYP